MAVFLCNFRTIFHSDTESDGSGVFHLLIVNVLTGVFRCQFCWDSHNINHGSTGTAVFWSGLHGCLRQTFPLSGRSSSSSSSCCIAGSCRHTWDNNNTWKPNWRHPDTSRPQELTPPHPQWDLQDTDRTVTLGSGECSSSHLTMRGVGWETLSGCWWQWSSVSLGVRFQFSSHYKNKIARLLFNLTPCLNQWQWPQQSWCHLFLPVVKWGRRARNEEEWV